MPDHKPVAVGHYPKVGIHVAYYEKPYRQYRITTEPPCEIQLADSEAVSVTTALGVLAKPALIHYAARETADGIRHLMRKKGYRIPQQDMAIPDGARAYRLPARVTDDPNAGQWLFTWAQTEAAAKEDPRSVIRLGKWYDTLSATRILQAHLAQAGLDHQSKTNEAAERGVDVHQVWEDWNARKLIPNAQAFPENRRGYIRGLASAIVELQPESVETEAVVGSAVHGFAGRLDTVVTFTHKEWGRCLVDLKTSKDVYPSSHFPQLRGYKIARAECGLCPTDREGILQVGADGSWKLGWSDDRKLGGPVADEDFLCVLAAAMSQRRFSGKRRGS